ncbi:hypothetical protein, partial [Arenimonas sp. SCN 70-307]|uniref:hypothetical protein n=1 Tax=Arenimonas sp. SCN 70-307 TaxID=1660089 RepID=UPI0025C2C4B1
RSAHAAPWSTESLWESLSNPSKFSAAPPGGQFSSRINTSQQESGLSLAYIPLSKVTNQIDSRVFNRPLAHKAKLELVLSRLSSRQA